MVHLIENATNIVINTLPTAGNVSSDHTILRIDLCMDIGKYSGQIVGAFVQGAEWFTIEENLHFPNGYLHIKGPKTINSWG
ncbi:hypothetical protein C2G38_2188938 [Gigaspora rosea]|uniref:Uncharacterized protein n=1 Tax=Gigaspora rosea TaxID=44941 RepID=A0A397V2Q6_9GLOM|nr:hypothetical protein C2G38_2188938 [Gigaspora rosea]